MSRELYEKLADRFSRCGIVGAYEVAEQALELLDRLTARKSILQDWVTDLGLRHQGVLLTAVRGCDTAPKDDASKAFTRCFRAMILNTHCEDPARAKSFIEHVLSHEREVRFHAFRKNLDHYPHHYVMHVAHAVEIIGYKHPDGNVREQWKGFYLRLCRGLHVNPETEAQLDARLNADEETFARAQR